MSAILRLFVFLLCSLAAQAQLLDPGCKQFLLVTSQGWNEPKAQLQRWEKHGENWVQVGRPIPAILGRAGMAWGLGETIPATGGPQKKEGDNRAPAGIYRITQLWERQGIAAPPRTSFPVQRIYPDTIGVDDPQSRHYNRILRSSQVKRPDWDSWEKMDIPDYDRVLVVSHNLDRPVPGRGSCIFIHRWETADKPTSGCTAMAERDLIELINWLRPTARPRLVQLPESEQKPWLKSLAGSDDSSGPAERNR